MKLYLCFFLFCALAEFGYCQQSNTNIDSIKSLALVDVHDSTSLSNLIYLAYLHESKDPSFALKCCVEARKAAQHLPYDEMYLKSYYMQAKVLSILGEFDSAILLLDTLSKHPNFENYTEVMCDCYKAKANIFKERKNLDLAIENYILSIENGKLVNDFGCWGGGLLNLGHLHNEARNYDMAKYYYTEAKEVLLESDRYHILCYVYRNLSNFEENYDASKLLIDTSFYYANLAKNEQEAFLSFNQLGILNYKNGKYKEAINSFKKGLDRYDSSNTYDGLIYSYLRLAICYQQIEDDKNAIKWFDQHLNKLMNNEDVKSKPTYSLLLSRYHSNNEDYKSALEYYQKFKLQTDMSFKEVGLVDFNDKETKYRTLEKENQIAMQALQLETQQNARNKIIIGGITLLFIASGIYFWYYLRQLRKGETVKQALQVEKERAANLQHLDKLKDQFFTNISHELRTPLTLITDPLSNVLQTRLDESARTHIELAHRNSKRLLQLVNEIMDLSKLEAGNFNIDKVHVEVVPLCRRIFMTFESFAKTRDIELLFVNNINDNQRIYTDIRHIERMLNNLISNAIKFSESGQMVTFKVEQSNNILQLSVTDKGKGIEQSELSLIFDRYYQTKQGSNLMGGSGVGLALVKQLSELLSLELSVESELDQGSSFTISVPLDEQHLENSEIAVNSNDLHKRADTSRITYSPLFINGEKPKILVLEDNSDMGQYLMGLLSPSFQCVLLNNGIDGLHAIQKNQFDLVLSDVMMPGLNGFELKRKINQIFKDDLIPYMFLTARSLEDDVLTGLRLGVDDYITKPFNSMELLARINNLIKNKIERSLIPDKEVHSTENERFMKSLENHVLNNLENPQFKVLDLAKELAIGQKQLSRKIKALTGLRSIEFILEIRLQKAKQLINKRIYNHLGDVRAEIGIDSASYFSRKYKERFGVSPTEDLLSTESVI